MQPSTGRTVPGPQVVLVRQWHDHHGAGGCCGSTEALSGLVDTAPRDCDAVPDPAARAAAGTGALYLELRARLPLATVSVVDSRNWLWLVPTTYRAARRQGAQRLRAALTATRATTPGAVLVDGVVVDRLGDEPAAVVAERVVAGLDGRSGTMVG